MTQRGRGILEIKPTRNPFFQTVNSDLGAKPNDDIEWRHDVNPAFVEGIKTKRQDENFQFLYSRTSDSIGAHVSKSQPFLPQMPSKAEFLKNRIENIRKNIDISTLNSMNEENEEVSFANVESMLQSYKHEPKLEDPRYTTTNNEIGRKPPSVATFVAERHSKRQDFSKSFNSIKPKNTSLNTSLSKSNVHKELDPQFM